VGLTAYWVYFDTGVYHYIGSMVGKRWDNLSFFLSIYLTFLVPFVGWIAIMLPLRRLTSKPPLRQELATFSESYRTEHAKNEALYITEPAAYTPAMRRRVRYIGLLYLGLGATLILAAALSLIVSLQEGYIHSFQILLIVVGLTLIGSGLYQLLTGRSVIRR
jgi:hypothetical protein